ncbi:hypothetical protein Droror1_Dr00018036 [Drosera rotundifolia]
MSRILRWQRICILCLLSLSLITPIFLVPYRLKSLTPGRREFVEGLSDMNYRADVLKLSAIEQEDIDGIKEPNQEVYREGNYSIVNHISEEDTKSKHLALAGEQTAGSEISGKDTGGKQQDKQVQSEEILSLSGGKESLLNQTVRHNQRVRSPQVKGVQHRQEAHVQRRRPSDEKVKQMKDHLVRAKAYLSFSVPASHSHLPKELRQRTKELERALGDARKDSELPRSAVPRMRNMEATLSKASRVYPDCSSMVKKLRAMTQSAEDQVQAQKQQSIFLTQLAGRTTPKGLHCLSMRLTAEFFTLDKQKLSNQQKYNDPKLFHIAVFSDNVLASAVVVNSTVSNAKEPKKIVFHVITDSLNFPAMSMWFILNPPAKATVQVLSIDDFQWLPKDYDSLLEKQKSLDPRYGSPLNQLRFYLPDIFPRLNKILFVDHDVVVQRDLGRLWSLNMKQKVNGAVQTCQEGKPSHHRMDMYIDFSQPLVAEKFDPNACTWAFGMNFFDLKEWRHLNLSGKYHDLLVKGNETPLCKAGSLPLGWLVFYNHTLPLGSKWHVLGLGYESGMSMEEIEEAAVIHYDGIMKPWLDIGIRKYKGYWNKYLDFNHPYLQPCNIHGW